MSVTLGALSCVLDAYGLIRVGLVETVERGERVCQPPTPAAVTTFLVSSGEPSASSTTARTGVS